MMGSDLLAAEDLQLCFPFDFACATNNAAVIIGGVGKAASNTVLKSWADGVFETLTDTLVRIGTFWVGVETPDLKGPSSEAVFVQSHLHVFVIAAVMISVIAAGIQLATGRSGRPVRDLVASLLTYMTVAVAGIAIVNYMIQAADAFSQWILDEATGGEPGQFAFSLFQGGLVAGQYTGTLGPILIIILGLFGILANVVQIGMMMLRSAFLVILVGILPISAACTNTTWGRSWFTKNVTWLVAFLLYKPAASIVYAVAIKLTSRSGFADQWSNDDITTFIMGILLLVSAVLVLPALVGFVVPASAAMSQGGPGVGDTAVMGAMATGSVMSMHSSHSSSAHMGGGGAAPAPSSARGSDSSASPASPQTPSPADAGSGASASSSAGTHAAGATGTNTAGAGATSSGAAAGATVATGGVAAALIAGAQVGSEVTKTASEAATGAAGGTQA